MSSTTLSCLRCPHHSWIHNDNCPPFSRVPETSNKNPQPPPDSWFSGNLSPYLLNLSKVSDLSSLYLLKLSPPSVSLAPPSPIFFPLFCPLLDLSPCLLKLPVPSTAMDPTTLCFTVCHHTHPPWRVHPICGLHRHPHPDTSQIHGSSPESTLEPPWTPLEHSTLSSREPKPILVSTPIPENQTYNNKTHSLPVFPISIKSTTTHTLALPEIWKNFSSPLHPISQLPLPWVFYGQDLVRSGSRLPPHSHCSVKCAPAFTQATGRGLSTELHAPPFQSSSSLPIRAIFLKWVSDHFTPFLKALQWLPIE